MLSLTLDQSFCRDLLHWRTSRAQQYQDSALSSFADDDAEFTAGPACGAVLQNVRLGEGAFLFDRLRSGFHPLAFAGAAGLDAAQEAMLRAVAAGKPLVRVLVTPCPTPAMAEFAEVVVADPDGRIAARYAAPPGAAYLARPDLHVCARWLVADAERIEQAIGTACGGAA